jgi:uncharacterized damage-inducible protein DinB
MTEQQKWVERKFNFDFPTGLFPCILARLHGAPVRLDELLRNAPPSILIRKAGEAWSIQEHAGHLHDLDELHAARIDDFLSGAKVLRAADMTNRRTTDAGYNAKNIADVLSAFRRERESFVRRLESLSDADIIRTAEHPRLKKQMRLIDMAYFAAEHDDHHFARMRTMIGGG